MYQSLKVFLMFLKVLGYSSLKSPTECHGCWYYLWSFSLLFVTAIGIVNNQLPPITLVYYISILFIHSMMIWNALYNEKQLIEIFKNVSEFDSKIDFVSKGTGRSQRMTLFWVFCLMVKAVLSLFLNFHIAIILAILLAINSNMVNLFLANAIYEQLALRYSALGQRLAAQVTRSGHLTVDLSHILEDLRLLCLSLSQQVTKVNNYLGLRLFGVVLVTILHCFMKVHILFTYQKLAIQLPIPRAILVMPDEIVQIIYLTVTADSLVDEYKKILTLLKNIPVYNMTRETKMQVELFILQIKAKPVELSAYGFFTVTRKLILSITITSATYFVTFYLMKKEISKLTNYVTVFINESTPFNFKIITKNVSRTYLKACYIQLAVGETSFIHLLVNKEFELEL